MTHTHTHLLQSSHVAARLLMLILFALCSCPPSLPSLPLSLSLSPSLSISLSQLQQTNKQKARGRWNTNNKTNRKHEAGETRTTKQTNIDNWNCESIYARLRHSWYGAWGYMVTQIYGDIIAATIFWLAPTAIPYSTLELHLQVIIIWGDQKCKCNEELIRK